AAGAWDRRVTHGAMDGVPAADWVLLDGEGGGAAVAPDGTVGARGSQAAECADAAAALLDRWERAGAPMVEDWWVSFATTGEPARPIWAPERWTL
ncbi:MAG TPA: methyltransferase, partial [Pilimelia sp.]|nr:methyltransferase [Pilimelia sp.]